MVIQAKQLGHQEHPSRPFSPFCLQIQTSTSKTWNVLCILVVGRVCFLEGNNFPMDKCISLCHQCNESRKWLLVSTPRLKRIFKNVFTVFFKVFFILKYIKIYFLFKKIIFNINTSKYLKIY
jgi:hypothetical protein